MATISDNFNTNYVDDRSWIQVTGGIIEETCPSQPTSKCLIMLSDMSFEAVVNRRKFFALQW